MGVDFLYSFRLGATSTSFEKIIGREKPHEIVMLSAHSDSWDLGQGAMDDGGGMAAIWQAMRTIKLMADKDPAFRPKRFG